jgi:hypothetical protein
VRDGYALGLRCEQIAGELAGRTPTAVAARAAKLGLATYARRWSAADYRMLRRLARDGVPLEHAARILARTPAAVCARARKLGINAPQRSVPPTARRRWSSQEDERLALHAELNPALLAELLDRTPDAVVQRIRRLGLRAGSSPGVRPAPVDRRAEFERSSLADFGPRGHPVLRLSSDGMAQAEHWVQFVAEDAGLDAGVMVHELARLLEAGGEDAQSGPVAGIIVVWKDDREHAVVE